ncbi:MAG TPA: protein kinase [Pyrinomonadaceae bacterium]|jgi:serine/threonine-protein kinase
MTTCPSCSQAVAAAASFCPTCGASLSQDSVVATQLLPAHRPAPRAARAPSSFDTLDRGRFVAGTMLADRYRIIALLGRGGMGEVYKAEDLKLEQTVALKFLPESLSSDGAALARLYREVRVARQISHRNVCRVYDIGEAAGQHFLSMEFVPGEELASLLRRIGRLPHDKAVEVARQLCAGLAAAHDNGVLHRDLKPANVMIDDAGNVRVTDFGLAGLAEEFQGRDVASGTPAYMAPEQLAGREVTIRSDLYALGLVIYEIFTGRRAFEARSVEELLRLRETTSTPTSPSSIVKEIDPLVERVIERCLETEPGRRPASALQVAAALPGGDPIAAALAAGETPSPEMVAAAPKEGVLRPAVAVALLGTYVAVLALCCWMSKYTSVYRMSPLDKPPEALRERARDVIKRMGYTGQPFDAADGMIIKDDYLQYVADRDSSASRWERLRGEAPGAYRFWYRQSPRYFETVEDIAIDRPALDVSGMASVYLDMEGRLHWFVGVPPQREPAEPAPPAPDWSLLFREAGLDIADFRTVASTWVPLHAYDARAAWDGSDPSQPDSKIHVEAAAFRGRLTYFETIYPWDQPARQEQPPESGRDRALIIAVIAVYLVALVGSALLARRNVRLGRGDRRGGARVAFFYLAVLMAVWLFNEHHNGSPGREFLLFFLNLSSAVFMSVFLWLLYVALEPFVRRRWPERIISWSRLLTGAWRDPLVGRDVLLGAVFGGGLMVCGMLTAAAPRWLGLPPRLMLNPGVISLGARYFIPRFASQITAGLFLGFISLFMLLLFVVVLRRERLAFVALWLLLTLLYALVTRSIAPMIPVAALGALLVVFVLYRFGLLATISALFFTHLWVFFPLTTELTAWYATDFTIALAVALALALYGFHTSLAGQPLLRRGLLEE